MAAQHLIVATPNLRRAATSGELRAAYGFAEGPRRHRLIANVRARDQDRRYGGSASVDLGSASIFDPGVAAEPTFVFGPQSRDEIRQFSGGIGYEGRWAKFGGAYPRRPANRLSQGDGFARPSAARDAGFALAVQHRRRASPVAALGDLWRLHPRPRGERRRAGHRGQSRRRAAGLAHPPISMPACAGRPHRARASSPACSTSRSPISASTPIASSVSSARSGIAASEMSFTGAVTPGPQPGRRRRPARRPSPGGSGGGRAGRRPTRGLHLANDDPEPGISAPGSARAGARSRRSTVTGAGWRTA